MNTEFFLIKSIEQLRESEEKHRLLIDNPFLAIGIFSLQTNRYIYCNPKTMELFGCTREEFLSYHPSQICPKYQSPGEKSKDLMAGYFKRLLEAGELSKFDWLNRRKDGTVFHTETSISVINYKGKPHILFISSDVEARKQKEKELARSRELYHTIARNLPGTSVLIFDRDHKYLLAEGQPLADIGLKSESIEGKTHYEVFGEAGQAAQLKERYQQVLSGQTIHFEYRHNDRIYDIRMFPLQDEHGDIYAGMIVSQDITEKRRISDTVDAISAHINVPSEQLFFENLITGLGRSLNMNHIVAGEFDLEARMIRPVAYWQDGGIISPVPYSIENAPCGEVLDGKMHFCRGGLQKLFEGNENLKTNQFESYIGAPLFDSEDRVIGLIAAISEKEISQAEMRLNQTIFKLFTARAGAEMERRKVTRALEKSLDELSRKNLELEKYIASNLELERFAYVASHDLREPLRTISGFAQLLERRYSDQLDDSAKEYINFIVGGAQTMNQFIKDLLNYSRTTSMESKFQEVETVSFMQEVVDSLSEMIADSKAEIIFSDLPKTICVSRAKMLQVMQNLISNSIKFRNPSLPLQIEVACQTLENKHIFSVRDNGIGIEAQYFEKVFMPFRKLHTKDTYPGSGIGLAICKRIIEQHGGRMWLESEPQAGSAFFFSIKEKPIETPSLRKEDLK